MSDNRPEFRFSLIHLLYVMAVIAASLAIFGWGGLFAALAILWAWMNIFQSRRPVRALGITAFLVVVLCLWMALWGTISTPREAARRMVCGNNLKHIALGLHNYHDEYGSLPPAYVADEKGKPMHSWRVLILPYIDEAALYRKYRFDEPWDGPNNRRLAAQMPFAYRCLSQTDVNGWTSTSTNYVAVVGEGTAWPGAMPRTFDEFTGGTSTSLLVMESDRAIPNWMEPRDLTLDEAIPMLTRVDYEPFPHQHKDFFVVMGGGREIAFADGSISYLPAGMELDEAKGLLTVHAGRFKESLASKSDSNSSGRLPVRYNYGNLFRLAVFLIVALLPLPRVWRSRSTSASSEPENGRTPNRVSR